jgi:hypothetical protein
VQLLVSMAGRMGELRERVVFLGGTVLPLLITDPDVHAVRFAKDVDAVFAWSDKQDLYAFEDGLWDLGFERRTSGAITRWSIDDTGFDVLPADPATVGFDAGWLDEAWQSAMPVELNDQLSIKIVAAPALLAVKFTAFLKRGHGNYFTSSDIADVLVLCAGRSQVTAEVASYPSTKLKKFVKDQLKLLQAAFANDSGAAAQGRFLKLMPPRVLKQALERIGKITAK